VTSIWNAPILNRLANASGKSCGYLRLNVKGLADKLGIPINAFSITLLEKAYCRHCGSENVSILYEDQKVEKPSYRKMTCNNCKETFLSHMDECVDDGRRVREVFEENFKYSIKHRMFKYNGE